MQYVYHGAPEPMVGNELIPLNKMPDFMAKVRDLHLAKYKGREEILERRIPLLDCLWNDVVQFLPLHPRKVFELQVQLGIIPEVPPYKFFEIPVSMFELPNAVVFFKSAAGEENVEVKWLKDVNMADLQQIPQATIDYYKTLIGSEELPFNYQFIPHVLYRGAVDVSRAKIISI